jgi:hypothetical protein
MQIRLLMFAVGAPFLLGATEEPKQECVITKSLKVSVKKGGASTWEVVPMGTRLELIARGTPYSDVAVPQGRGRLATTALDRACTFKTVDAPSDGPTDGAAIASAAIAALVVGLTTVDAPAVAPVAVAAPPASTRAGAASPVDVAAPAPVVPPLSVDRPAGVVAPSDVPPVSADVPAPVANVPDVVVTTRDVAIPDVAPPAPPLAREPEAAAPGKRLDGRTVVAVLDLKAEGDGAPAIANALGAIITSAVSTRPGYRAVSRNELKALLAHAADAQLAGCESLNCMTDIAKLADAGRIVSGTLGRVEGEAGWLVTVSLTDPSVPAILARANVTWRGAAVEIVTVVPSLLDRLFDGTAAASYVGDLEVFAPDGVTVAIDGRELGRTPLGAPLKGLPIGVHTVTVAGAGYVAQQVDVVVSRSELTVVRVELEEEPYYTQWWFWTVLGGGSAVAVAGGVAAALLLSVPPPTTIVVKAPLPQPSESAR